MIRHTLNYVNATWCFMRIYSDINTELMDDNNQLEAIDPIKNSGP